MAPHESLCSTRTKPVRPMLSAAGDGSCPAQTGPSLVRVKHKARRCGALLALPCPPRGSTGMSGRRGAERRGDATWIPARLASVPRHRDVALRGERRIRSGFRGISHQREYPSAMARRWGRAAAGDGSSRRGASPAAVRNPARPRVQAGHGRGNASRLGLRRIRNHANRLALLPIRTAASRRPSHAAPVGEAYRMRAPKALAASSTASRPVAFSRSRIGFTSTISNEPTMSASAMSSIARWASR
jgi:hypothetical protein